ncbi:MAG: transketolase C-terminal domain-containing protein [Selenomonadaceae bacterium]
MSKIANKQAICNVLLAESASDKDIVVLCSDSRGSASLAPFAKNRPDQFVEVGIAEQNLVSMSAGLASCGKKPFAVSPASFLSTRSMEQVKVDVAYSKTNVTLIGISGGVSYGALGMTHHSANDIAAMASIPNMRVYLPSDHLQTTKLIEALLQDTEPAYVRVGRNAVDEVYEEGNVPFSMNKATVVMEGNDVTIIACGEMVKPAKDAASILQTKGISTRVLDMYCVKPIDKAAVIKAAQETKAIVTIEEHTKFGGLGSMVSQIVAAEKYPKRVINMSLPDEPVVTGKSKEVFDHYGLNAAGIVKTVMELI